MARLRADGTPRSRPRTRGARVSMAWSFSVRVTWPTRPAPTRPGRTQAAPFRPVAVVVRGESEPHLYTAYWDGVPRRASGRSRARTTLPRPRGRHHEFTEALRRTCPAGSPPRGWTSRPTRCCGPSTTTNGPMPAACWEPPKSSRPPTRSPPSAPPSASPKLAMESARAALRPGLRQTDLSGIFLRRLFELGATANAIDPIWQVMGPTRAEGPWTIHGDLAYPTPTTDRILREGDVIWVDAGICHQGYASDFGRTWLTGATPRPPSDRPAISSAGAPWSTPPVTFSSRACPPRARPGSHRRQRRRQTVAGALLPRPRGRHRQCGDAPGRHRPRRGLRRGR